MYPPPPRQFDRRLFHRLTRYLLLATLRLLQQPALAPLQEFHYLGLERFQFAQALFPQTGHPKDYPFARPEVQKC